MARLLGNPSIHLSGSLVSHVFTRHHAGLAGDTTSRLQTAIGNNAPVAAPRTLQNERQPADVATGSFLSSGGTAGAVPARWSSDTATATSKRKAPNCYNSSVRRQKCRANQARYRDRQRAAQLQLEKKVEELNQEVGSLKRAYRERSSQERSNLSPWSTVAKVFRLLESSFRSPWRMVSAQEMKNHSDTRQILADLESSFAHDAAMGDLVGFYALMEQLRHYTQFFGEAHLKLHRVEAAAPGVMAAKATLSVTVTEFTLRHVFPNLVQRCSAAEDSGEQPRSLYDRILGQRLLLCCTVNFLFDEESCRVVRLDCKIDLATAFLRALGDLKDVADVLKHALITSEGIIGDKCDLRLADHDRNLVIRVPAAHSTFLYCVDDRSLIATAFQIEAGNDHRSAFLKFLCACSSQCHTYTTPTPHVECGYRQDELGDAIVGLVRPRTPQNRHQTDSFLGKEAGRDGQSLRSTHAAVTATVSMTTLLSPAAEASTVKAKETSALGSSRTNPNVMQKRECMSRREQCKDNQARYRQRQREFQQQLHSSVQLLRQELDALIHKRQELVPRGKNIQSLWAIVAEVFRLLGSCFQSLERSVLADVICAECGRG
ncbi:hypothetical protein PHYPSEUDO_004090 [Phytophthora pseudosyringae]|uniref:Bzip transcription factor n=1 Tax=Phytophthora pseudosyringae TaxID=221518 RepID=A0A8T1WG95_9STRA|nr:hypothetical protein PHYPSEUDO_004090 [Phytophthora pseudosyringae]